MSLLEDARRLAALYTITDTGEWRFVDHSPCYEPSCPHLALPQLVAVLEAAERLTDDAQCWAGTPGGNMPRDVEWLQVRRDAYEALQSALRGEAPTA